MRQISAANMISLSLSLSFSLSQSLPPTLPLSDPSVAQQILCYESISSLESGDVCQGTAQLADSIDECCLDPIRGAGYMVPANDTNQCFSCMGVTGVC